MKCYCYETETEFVLCVENVDTQYEDNLRAAWFEKHDNRFTKTYSILDKENGIDAKDRETIERNFAQLGPSMFKGQFNWENVLFSLAKKFLDQDIEWYVIGSISEVLLGVDIKPHDIDIVIHTKDFFKVKNAFSDFVVEPFVDNKGTWVVRYFGRLCVDGAIVDIAADEKMNLGNQHQYDQISWNNFDIWIEP